jgi:hypothetical protein
MPNEPQKLIIEFHIDKEISVVFSNNEHGDYYAREIIKHIYPKPSKFKDEKVGKRAGKLPGARNIIDMTNEHILPLFCCKSLTNRIYRLFLINIRAP